MDKVYIAVEEGKNPQYVSFLKGKIQDNPKITLVEHCHPWPDSYADAIKVGKEDLLLIMHDDCYVLDPNVLDEYFQLAASGKVAVPLHEIYSPADIVEPMLENRYPGTFPLRLKNQVGNPGAFRGYSFLLYFLFISRTNLEKTAMDFNGWSEKNMAADTGFGFMLDLLNHQIEIQPIPRFDTVYGGGTYIHLQNIGNTIPDLLGITDPISPAWDMKILKGKLDWIDKFMAVDDYHELPEFKEKVQKRLEYLRRLI